MINFIHWLAERHRLLPHVNCRRVACQLLTGTLVIALLTACSASTDSHHNEQYFDPESELLSRTEEELIDYDEGIIVLKYGHSQTEDHPFHLSALYLSEIVKERTNGRVHIDVYSNNSLGDEISLLKGIAVGSVDMGSVATGNMSAVVKDFAVFEIPYLFSDYNHVDAALRDGAASLYMEEAAQKHGITILSWSESGFRHFLNAQKNIYLPTDLAGMNVRTPEWGIFANVCNSFGAKVISMPFSEVYTASQHGIIDAQEGPLMAFVTGNMYETMKYLTLDSHIYAGDCKIISNQSLSLLSEEDQEILAQATYEAGEYQREMIRSTESRYLQQLKDFGVTVVEQVDKSAWQEACDFVYEKYSDQLNMHLVDLIKSANPDL